jgi:hypothetical protein
MVANWNVLLERTKLHSTHAAIFAGTLEMLWSELNPYMCDRNRHDHLFPDALMVLLTLTPATKSAVELYNQLSDQKHHGSSSDPSLSEPTVGAPVSHAQLIQVARFLRESQLLNKNDFRLDTLLKGANIYVSPPKPKPQPVCIHTILPSFAIALC